MSSFVHYFKVISEFKQELQSGNGQFRSKLAIFFPCDLEIWQMTLKNNRAPLLRYFKLSATFRSHPSIQLDFQYGNVQFRSKSAISCPTWPWNLTDDLENKANLRDLIAATGLVILLKFDPNHWFFSPCDLEIWCMTLKNNRAPLLYYIKLCVSFQIHRWIKTEVTLRKRSIRVEISDFFSLVTLKFGGWPWKTIRHLFYTTSSFVHHFKSIGEMKLKLQSRNAQFGSKSVIFCQKRRLFEPCDLEILRMTLKKIGHLFYATSSFVYHFVSIGEFKLELQSGNAQFKSNSMIFRAVRPWNLTDDLAKRKGTLLCYFKLCAAFRTHWWIQTGVTVRKRPIWVKFDDF